MVLGMRSVLNTDMDTDTQTQTHRPTHTSFLHHFEKYAPPVSEREYKSGS